LSIPGSREPGTIDTYTIIKFWQLKPFFIHILLLTVTNVQFQMLELSDLGLICHHPKIKAKNGESLIAWQSSQNL